jgi:hypothetical protein
MCLPGRNDLELKLLHIQTELLLVLDARADSFHFEKERAIKRK